jgi:PhzF family phenazine biosynthesis protein
MDYFTNRFQKKLAYYIVDTFTLKVFGGNPAGVVHLEEWLPDDILLSIASENNLSETSFFINEGDCFHLRWFSPTQEVPLCGHATLAAAYIIFNRIDPDIEKINFKTISGIITVRLNDNRYELDMPLYEPVRILNPPPEIEEGLGTDYLEVLRVEKDPNYYVILKSEEDLKNLAPRFEILARLHPYGIAVSAAGNTTDFASRYFAPGYGINEDPVTGSIHSALTPFWGHRLNKSILQAAQLSVRKGELHCELFEDFVRISGHGALYLEGEISISI